MMVPVPLPPQGSAADELRARAVVAAAYGATHLLADDGRSSGEPRDRSGDADFDFRKIGLEVLAEGEWAYDPRSEVWRPLALIEAGAEQGELTRADLDRLYRAVRRSVAAAVADGGVHTLPIVALRRPDAFCPRCGAPMVHGTVAGRTTWWCSREQA